MFTHIISYLLVGLLIYSVKLLIIKIHHGVVRGKYFHILRVLLEIGIMPLYNVIYLGVIAADYLYDKPAFDREMEHWIE